MAHLHIFLALAAFIAAEAIQVPSLSKVQPKFDALPDDLPLKAALRARNSHLDGKIGSRIVNGYPAQQGQFPYQAALFIDQQEFCGGSVIAQNWILTAGHCGQGARSVIVILGSLSIQQGDPSQVVMQSYQIITHPGFSMGNLQNDVSLVQLSGSIPSSPTISAISLSTSQVGAGEMAVVSGWGKTSDSSNISPYLKYAQLVTISNEECGQYYGGYVYDGNVCCTSASAGSGTTCQGDSGGPLVINGAQIGIVSFGGQSCLSSPPAFTRISTFYNWIAQTVNSN